MSVRAWVCRARQAATALLTMVVVASCTDGSAAPSEVSQRDSAVVTAGQATSVRVGELSVTVPVGGAPEGATLTLSREPADNIELPSGFTPVGDAAVADLDDGRLLEPATVTFPVPSDIDGTTVIPVVLWEDDGDWRWLPTTYRPGDPTISATTDHFSSGFLASIDVQRWAEDRKDDFVNYISGRAGVAQPKCGDEEAARADGLQVSSDRGDTIKWCFGVERGQHVLKVANNRRTYTQVTYPSSWQVGGPPSLSLSPQTINRALSTTLAGATAPRGHSVRIIDGGDTLTLIVPPGGQGNVLAEVSMYGWLLSAMQFGIETYAAIAKVAGKAGEAAAGSWERISARLADLGAASNGYRDAFEDCGLAVSQLTESDAEVADVAPDLLNFLWDCLPGLMKADIEESGVTLFAAGIVLSAIGAVTGLVLGALHLLITGIREVWDELASFGGDSDAFYDIHLVLPRPPGAEFFGEWYVHGGSMRIEDDGSGVFEYQFTCGPDSEQWCTDFEEFRYGVSEEGDYLVGTVETVSITDSRGISLIEDYFPIHEVGDQFMLEFVADHLLLTTIITGAEAGNPYWCRDGVSPEDGANCGA